MCKRNDRVNLLLGQEVAASNANADAPRDSIGRALVVSGEHDGLLDAVPMQFGQLQRGRSREGTLPLLSAAVVAAILCGVLTVHRMLLPSAP